MTDGLPARREAPWTAPVRFLPRYLLEPRNAALAILVGWLTAFMPSILLGAAVGGLLPNLGQPQLPMTNEFALVLVVVVAPLIETLIMAAVLSLLLLLFPSTVAVLISALGWGVAHSLAAPAWGLVIWWPFLIFSVLYVTWRQRSLAAALAVPAATHALQNTLPALLLLAGLQSPSG